MKRPMNEKWRLIIDPPLRGSLNMARDLAILKSLSRGTGPSTLRLYRWEKPAVTIGYFQVPEDELDTAECKRDGVDIIRRVTGGGAVLHQYEITYSLCIPLQNRLAFGTVLESYKRICEPLVRTLRDYGLDASYHAVNDILIGDKKVSGSAQTRRDGVLLQHGTILLSLDTEKMFRYLKMAGEKMSGRKDDAPASRVVSLSDFLGGKVLTESFQADFEERIQESFALMYDVDFTRTDLTHEEKEKAAEIEKAVFANPAWNRDRNVKI